jgi:hypothetical protein
MDVGTFLEDRWCLGHDIVLMPASQAIVYRNHLRSIAAGQLWLVWRKGENIYKLRSLDMGSFWFPGRSTRKSDVSEQILLWSELIIVPVWISHEPEHYQDWGHCFLIGDFWHKDCGVCVLCTSPECKCITPPGTGRLEGSSVCVDTLIWQDIWDGAVGEQLCWVWEGMAAVWVMASTPHGWWSVDA